MSTPRAVARFVTGQFACGCGNHREADLALFTDPKSTDGISWKIERRQFLRLSATQVLERRALDDCECKLVASLNAVLRALRPLQRTHGGFPSSRLLDTRWSDIVEDHRDIAAERLLQCDDRLRCKRVTRAVQVRCEMVSLVIDARKPCERKNLETAAVGKDCAGPRHELVQTASAGDQFRSRPQIQMVCVGEDDADPARRQLLRADALH
jgi:hypothetical protein